MNEGMHTLVDIENLDEYDMGQLPSTSQQHSLQLPNQNGMTEIRQLCNTASPRPARCQLCFKYRLPTELTRLPLKREKYWPILEDSGYPMELIKNLDSRLKQRIGIKVCKQHLPTLDRPEGVYVKRIPTGCCKLCGERRTSYNLRSLPSGIDRRLFFYDYANVPTEKRQEFERSFKDETKKRTVINVCGEHFPKEVPKRHTTIDGLATDERGVVVKITTENPAEKRKQKRLEAGKPANPPPSSFCHWCSRAGNPRLMRKFPDHEEAVQDFFKYNNATESKEQEIRNKAKTLLRGVQICYEHFPPAWRYARGRFWYKLYFGTEKEKARARANKERRERRKSQLKTADCSGSEEDSIIDVDNDVDEVPYSTGMGLANSMVGSSHMAGPSHHQIIGSSHMCDQVGGAQMTSTQMQVPNPYPALTSFMNYTSSQSVQAAQALCSLGQGLKMSPLGVPMMHVPHSSPNAQMGAMFPTTPLPPIQNISNGGFCR